MLNARRFLPTALLALTLAGPVHADCFADYKAKLDDPLRLHYGVVQVPDAICGDPAQVRAEVAGRIARDGWHLLNVLGIFGPEGLEQRRESAGAYFLRY
jgi:hypothetical protein